jgi:hypothetical protein
MQMNNSEVGERLKESCHSAAAGQAAFGKAYRNLMRHDYVLAGEPDGHTEEGFQCWYHRVNGLTPGFKYLSED